MADNPYFAAFEKYYEQLEKALPMDSMYPTLLSKGLLRDPGLAENVEKATTDIAKARVFLGSMRPGLQIGGTETFELFLDAMTEYEMKTNKEEITILLSRIRQHLPSPNSPSPPSKQVEQTGPTPGPGEKEKVYPTAIEKYSTRKINSAYHKLTSNIADILETKNFQRMRRACYEEIRAIDSTLPDSLIQDLKPTKSLNDMLDVLALSPYWNWFDTRLLEALVSASRSPEAEELLEQFKQIHYSHRVNEILPYVSVVPLKNSVIITEKFKKEPHELTFLDIIEHKRVLEYDIFGTREKMVLHSIKTGCVELTWQVPQELVFQAYSSMKMKHDEVSSLAIESLVCEEADEYIGLPFLWHGQEVGKVGLIEPLPEHVRQEPYSLLKEFQWIPLSSSDADKVVNFIDCNSRVKFGEIHITSRNPYLGKISHPHARSEWQFGIRATNGNLVGIVYAHPVCMSIGGVSITCASPIICIHKKYHNKRLWYMLFKEFQRRANLHKINQFVQHVRTGLLKPITTLTMWKYQLTHSTRLPNSPSTPGWRKITSEDVCSALALVNKYASQFEIRQVFTSEEEFSHHFLCPTVPNYMFTYVVQNETKNITDLVSYSIVETNIKENCAVIQAVVSTQSRIQDLIRDAFVCAIEDGAHCVIIYQFAIENDVLSSLTAYLQQLPYLQLFDCYLCNYKYHSVSEKSCCFFF